jgi:hypothetical protein
VSSLQKDRWWTAGPGSIMLAVEGKGMTEAEWLACTDPTPMLGFLGGRASPRKLRLFAAACCRRVWHLLTDDRNRRAIDVAERYADGLVPKKALKAARRKTFQVRAERPPIIGQDYRWGAAFAEEATDGLTLGPHESAQDTAYHAAIALAYGATPGRERDERFQVSHNAERLVQARLLHEIFSDPFRTVALNPTWRTPTVTALATAAYDNRILPTGTLDPDRLAILADALEEAGCTDEQVLSHLRGPSGPHVRGCWVLDLLLDKK